MIFEGYALSGDIGGKAIVVYTNQEQAGRIAKVTNKGDAFFVLIIDNTKLAKLQIALKTICQMPDDIDNCFVCGWLTQQIKLVEKKQEERS
jgi:hypothetical protein